MRQFSLEEYLKNPSRKVITRDGQSVKIYCTNFDSNSGQLIVAEIEGSGYSTTFFKNGKYFKSEETPLDLFFAAEKHEGWIVINKWPDGVRDTNGIIYHTKLDIPDIPPESIQLVAPIKIEWEE